MTTSKSDEILSKAVSYLERDSILLPVFKAAKDKKYVTPYIEKNQPFIYRSAPDKNIYLNYKINDGVDFKATKMKYFRFGLYITSITHFYGEKITYFISEEMENGSIVTKEQLIENNRIFLDESMSDGDDPYFIINNALIYEQMFKYEQVESIITESLQELHKVKGRIIL